MANPFEIRTEVLAMAKDMLDKQYEAQLKMVETVYTINKDNLESVNKVMNEVKMYTAQDVMEKAQELYKFIADKK